MKKSLFSHYQSPTRRDEDHRHFGASVGSLCASMSTTSAGAPSLLAFEYGYDKDNAVITGTRRRRATRSNLNAKNDAVPPPSIRTRPGRSHSLDAAFASLFWAIAVSVLNEQLVQTFFGFGGHCSTAPHLCPNFISALAPSRLYSRRR